MSAWAHLVDKQDESYLEFMIGPFEQCVQMLPYGPTQLERALIHTPMLDLDHERRFVASQLNMDLSQFGSNHCWRLQHHLSTTEAHVLELYGHPAVRAHINDKAALHDTMLGGSQFSIDAFSAHYTQAISISDEQIQCVDDQILNKEAEFNNPSLVASPSSPSKFYSADELEMFMQSTRAQRRLESGPRHYRAQRFRKDVKSINREEIKRPRKRPKSAVLATPLEQSTTIK